MRSGSRYSSRFAMDVLRFAAAPFALFVWQASGIASGQTATMGTGSQGSNRAIALPQSGRTNQPGTVSTQQSASPSSGVATVTSSVQVGGDLSGSVPVSLAQSGPITLTLANALKLGLRANLGSISASNSVRGSQAQRVQTLSALLPNISANASETVTQVNLAAFGFQFKLPPGVNFSIPSVVGPFSYSQVEGSLSQSIYDPVARRNWQASKETERASGLSAKDTRELVVVAVGGTYLQTLAEAARVESQRAQVENARAVYNQAVTRKAAGTNSKIDVMRSLVELQTQQQRLSSFEADLNKQKIGLARVIGIGQDREIILAEPLDFRAPSVPEEPAAIEQAYRRRAD
ncbi:MAG: TolC family protein, partial [Acidobacteriota bacterium]|nr:TolC family protein [Acidobacteriota bacterium]